MGKKNGHSHKKSKVEEVLVSKGSDLLEEEVIVSPASSSSSSPSSTPSVPPDFIPPSSPPPPLPPSPRARDSASPSSPSRGGLSPSSASSGAEKEPVSPKKIETSIKVELGDVVDVIKKPKQRILVKQISRDDGELYLSTTGKGRSHSISSLDLSLPIKRRSSTLSSTSVKASTERKTKLTKSTSQSHNPSYLLSPKKSPDSKSRSSTTSPNPTTTTSSSTSSTTDLSSSSSSSKAKKKSSKKTSSSSSSSSSSSGSSKSKSKGKKNASNLIEEIIESPLEEEEIEQIVPSGTSTKPTVAVSSSDLKPPGSPRTNSSKKLSLPPTATPSSLTKETTPSQTSSGASRTTPITPQSLSASANVASAIKPLTEGKKSPRISLNLSLIGSPSPSSSSSSDSECHSESSLSSSTSSSSKLSTKSPRNKISEVVSNVVSEKKAQLMNLQSLSKATGNAVNLKSINSKEAVNEPKHSKNDISISAPVPFHNPVAGGDEIKATKERIHAVQVELTQERNKALSSKFSEYKQMTWKDLVIMHIELRKSIESLEMQIKQARKVSRQDRKD